jgi:hypothetical protein
MALTFQVLVGAPCLTLFVRPAWTRRREDGRVIDRATNNGEELWHEICENSVADK